jgi:enoyl-CoA hydratase
VAADPDARALVVTGAGRAFSAGGDRELLEQIAAGGLHQPDELANVHWDIIDSMLELPIPAIAAVNGPAIGISAGIASLCDFVVMGESAFLQDPHVRHGIGTTTALHLVWPRLTSYAHAKAYTMYGEKLLAVDAVRLGLANKLCPDGQELATALAMAEPFATMPTAGVAATKRSFNRALIEEVAVLKREARQGYG